MQAAPPRRCAFFFFFSLIFLFVSVALIAMEDERRCCSLQQHALVVVQCLLESSKIPNPFQTEITTPGALTLGPGVQVCQLLLNIYFVNMKSKRRRQLHD
ncbi:hypothetical protein DFH27DRAFT_210127 [Peziza echinospora]|nr:hypothetical protein DFH27DRAFT_210127 [Peziza echinospora]